MAQKMITKIPPQYRSDYPTPSTNSLKRKLDIFLAQDEGEWTKSAIGEQQETKIVERYNVIDLQ